VDKDGIIRYIDIHDIDQQPDNDLLRDIIRKIDPQVDLQQEKTTATPAEPPIPDAGIVLFCTPWCPNCRRARKWLHDRNLAYVEVDITKNVQAAEKVMGWANGNRTTPTINIDGRILVDWNETKLQETLLEKGYLGID
jgi:glutaredoxin